MYLNPIVKKDVKVQARSMKICWGVFAYELILALVFFLAMSIIQGKAGIPPAMSIAPWYGSIRYWQ